MSVVALHRLVRDALVDEKEMIEAGILQGVVTWEEYTRLCAKRQGLLTAIDVLDNQMRRFDEQE